MYIYIYPIIYPSYIMMYSQSFHILADYIIPSNRHQIISLNAVINMKFPVNLPFSQSPTVKIAFFFPWKSSFFPGDLAMFLHFSQLFPAHDGRAVGPWRQDGRGPRAALQRSCGALRKAKGPGKAFECRS